MDPSTHGASAGVGLRLAALKYVKADLQAAKGVDGPRNEWRFFFAVTGSY
jgi:hypothetical protein